MSNLKPLLLLSAYVGKAATQLLLLLAYARSGGADEAGRFAFAVAVCTPVFILSELALRNVFQTLRDAPPLVVFLLRVCTSIIAAAVVAVVASLVSGFPPASVLGLLLVLRVAERALDICYGGRAASRWPCRRGGRVDVG